MKFSEIPYEKQDPKKLIAGVKDLTERLKKAAAYEEAKAVFLEYEEKSKYVDTMSLVSMIRHQMDKKDKFYKDEDAFWWEFDPDIDDYKKAWAEAMLDSPFREDFAAEYGEMMFRNAEFDRRSTSEEITADKQRENRLIAEYGDLVSSVDEILFEGSIVDGDEIDRFKEDEDAERRLAAFMAEGECWREIAEDLDAVFDKLVKLRDGMGRKLGYDGFTDLGYCLMHRCFTPDDMLKFRDAVLKYVVPIACDIKRKQAERIGRPYPLAYSDNEYFFKSGNPHPAGDSDYVINEGRKFFESLSPEAGEFIRHMIDDEMMYVHAGGGNDINLPYYETPFLMVDLDGSGDSVRSFMHEAGHTFAYWMNRKRVPTDYITPSEDVTELHSMCMELLALRHAEGFFGPDAKKFTCSLLGEAIAFITYGTMVDHFQHIVFEHPELTPAQRHAEWLRLEAIYEPWIAFDPQMPYYGEGMLWQQQGHIYWGPFMYIDYVLSGAVALEVWAILQRDPQEAWDRYMALVRQGGSRPFPELLKHAGLTSPFDEACLKSACQAVKTWLDRFDLTGIE